MTYLYYNFCGWPESAAPPFLFQLFFVIGFIYKNKTLHVTLPQGIAVWVAVCLCQDCVAAQCSGGPGGGAGVLSHFPAVRAAREVFCSGLSVSAERAAAGAVM